MAPYILDNQKL